MDIIEKGKIMLLGLENTATKSLSIDEQKYRKDPRITLSLPAKLIIDNKVSLDVIIRNLSLSGFVCETNAAIPKYSNCSVIIPGINRMSVKIIWENNMIVGCSFQNSLTQMKLDSMIARYKEPTEYSL